MGQPDPGGYSIRPVPFTRVSVTGGMWRRRIETNRRVTVPYDFAKCEETGRIDNFAKAGGLMSGPFVGIYFNDSDVYKVIEGASYALAQHPDKKLEAYLDRLIEKIAAAQEEDGYLYTARTLQPGKEIRGAGKERWSFLAHSHELYNVGHLYEAAVAHYRATGKRSLLDVAVRNAELLLDTFGPGKRHDVAGHEEIEIGLIKLYRATNDRRYLDLARFFVMERGNPRGHKLYGDYAQDHKPVVEQSEAVGHAVRATYLYCAMADLAAITGDNKLADATDRIWNDVVSRKIYLTGGIGARRSGEAFGKPFELPNDTAYNETCAAIGNALWNYRMFLLRGDAKYLDVLERTVYNGFLVGVSLEGNRFFYPNPLEFDGHYPFNHGRTTRSPWFGTSCCPVNVVRFIPSLAGMIYATREDALYVNLFVPNSSRVDVRGTDLRVRQTTNYPWDGRVRLEVDPKEPTRFELRVRVPGWTAGRPLPSSLYRYIDTQPESKIEWTINGKAAVPRIAKGFACFDREWSHGDVVEFSFPMPVRRVAADARVAACAGRTAIERGPIVYCIEGVDHGGHVRHIYLPDDADLTARYRADLLGGVAVVTGTAKTPVDRGSDTAERQPKNASIDLVAVPYYAWNHRGASEMSVWIARKASAVRPLPKPTIASASRASASHVWAGDTVAAMNDQLEPKSSGDQGLPRFTWWDHRGTKEWVQYDFRAETAVSRVAVYWFDDEPVGKCRLPQSWRVAYLDDGKWKPVTPSKTYSIKRDRFDVVEFAPVKTRALRLEVQLQPGFSGGILEWKVGR